MKSIFGLIPVWNGSVIYNGENITNRGTRANVNNGIGFVPQGNRVFDEMTVLENLEIGGLHLPKDRFKEKVKFMMGHIRKINREFGVTVLIVEQKVREVLEICHHIYSIKLGKVAFEGSPDDLKHDKAKLKQLFL